MLGNPACKPLGLFRLQTRALPRALLNVDFPVKIDRKTTKSAAKIWKMQATVFSNISFIEHMMKIHV
jgi:hypothetical protein